MNVKTVFVIFIAGFVGLCAFLVIESCIFGAKEAQASPSAAVSAGKISLITLAQEAGGNTDDTESADTSGAGKYAVLNATHARSETVTLGKLYPEIERFDDPGKYKFFLELTSRGAAIAGATLSEFDDRDPDAPAHLRLLGSVTAGKTIYSLANGNLRLAGAGEKVFPSKALPLDRLEWRTKSQYSSDEATFTAIVQDASGRDTLKLIKTYRISPNSYDIECELTVENLCDDALKARFDMQGPVGMSREDVRQDSRKVKAAYRIGKNIESQAIDIRSIDQAKKDIKTPPQGFRKIFGSKKPPQERLKLLTDMQSGKQLWSALTNKYFAAIVRPIPQEDQSHPWLQFNRAQHYPALGEDKDKQNCSYSLTSQTITLAPAGSEDAEKSYLLEVYIGPKDKRIFEKNDTYKDLQYFQTIDFRGCCCPTKIIQPLAFGIMWLMNTMYTLMGPLGNYGVVIMILVFMMRLVMHPVTKKSQVSMMRMQKLAPKMEEIKKKYANNKAEMNKKVMALYREQGISPFASMLPMIIQMPVWIALWTAVYTSIDLRGAKFLPFWITDLSVPDQLFRFPFGIELPFFGEYFNLLPILMGVVMYLQQKLMPHSQSTAQTNPQVAQQQKMMMIMMPLLFPIMLYKGPSGVNLYILSSISAGVLEQIIIRKHIREKEQAEAQGLVA